MSTELFVVVQYLRQIMAMETRVQDECMKRSVTLSMTVMHLITCFYSICNK